MKKQTLITTCITEQPSKSPHKNFFTELFPQNDSDYNRNKFNASTQKLPPSKTTNSNYVTFKCQTNNSNSKNDKENYEKLPIIHCPKKPPLVDKYFSRNDIVKDRSQLLQRISCKCLDETTQKQSSQNNMCHKVQQRTDHVERMTKSTTKHSKTMETMAQKSAIQEKPKNLQQQMKQWALIKKKNEYEAFKLIRKNNYDRMKSNIIIAQAMKELLNMREQFLGKEEKQKQIYLPLNQSDIAELQK